MLITTWVAAGCGHETFIALGADCPPGLAVNEVFASNASVETSTTGRSDDFVELVYDPPAGEPDELDLSGYGLAATTEKMAWLEGPVHIRAGGFLVVIASPYEQPSVPGAPPIPVTGFDLQRDGASIFLLPPGSRDACLWVPYEDQHQDFSWIPDLSRPDEAWCPSATPTDGGPNAPCVCTASHEC